MALAKRTKQWAKAFETAFEVVNGKSGHAVTFHDHGVDANGSPVNGREGAIAKFSMMDEDGDPIFFVGEEGPKTKDGKPSFVFKGWPAHITRNDNDARVKLSMVARTAASPSMNSAFKTLGDKAAAARVAHEAKERQAHDEAAAGRQAKFTLPQELADIVKILGNAQQAVTNKNSTRALPTVGGGA